MIKVSVIVPVYNVEKYLAKCLDSLVKQTLKDIEIIVVNDGSPDASQKIIDRYAKKYPAKIKAYKKVNGGLSDARNYGLKKAHGEYVWFVDSDDYVSKDAAQALYENAQANNSDIVICDIIDEYEDKNIQEVYHNYVPKVVGNIYEDKKQMLNRFAAWNKLYRRQLFTKDLQFDKGKIYEDLRLIPKLYLAANKISYVAKPLYHYNIRQGSIMTSSSIAKNMDILDAFKVVITYFQEHHVYADFKEEIEYLAIEHILIACSLRLIALSKRRDIASNLEPYLTFVDQNFPNYMQNKYLTNLSRNRRLCLKLVKSKQFTLLKILTKIRG